MSKNPVAEQHSVAMCEHLKRRSAAIMIHNPDDTLRSVGSGTYIEIGGRYFVSTAAHVVEPCAHLSQVGVVALGGPVGKASNMTPKLVGWGRRGGSADHTSLDIAWLEIKPEAVPLLKSEWERIFVTLDRISLDEVPPDSALYVFGAPGDLLVPATISGKPFLGIVGLPYLTRALPMQTGGQPDRDIYTEYLRDMETANGTVPLPDARGLSGSGLWRVNPSTTELWTPDRAQLVGVQHRWAPGDFLLGTVMLQWLQMVRDDIPELQRVIDPVLNRRP